MKKTSKWISFLGGRDLIFSLVVLILIGLVILLYRELNFIFYPLVVIFSNILLPTILAAILYYIFSPLVNYLEKRKVPRSISIIGIYLILILLMVWGLSAAIPSLVDQVQSLVEAFPGYVERLAEGLEPLFSQVVSTGTFSQYAERFQDFLGRLPEIIFDFLQGGFSGLSSVLSGVTNVVVTVIFVPIILFFLLKDDQLFIRGFIQLLPPNWRNNFVRVAREMSDQVGSYVKGQLTVAFALGVMTYIGFKIIGLDYAGVLAITTGVLSIIPYLGPTLSFIPALVIALLNSWFMVLKLIIVWLTVQFIEGNILQPQIMGQQLSIHPLTIIIILFVAGDLAGVFGMVFGIPIYAILKVLVVYWFEKFKQRYNYYLVDDHNEYSTETIETMIGKGDPSSEDE